MGCAGMDATTPTAGMAEDDLEQTPSPSHNKTYTGLYNNCTMHQSCSALGIVQGRGCVIMWMIYIEKMGSELTSGYVICQVIVNLDNTTFLFQWQCFIL